MTFLIIINAFQSFKNVPFVKNSFEITAFLSRQSFGLYRKSVHSLNNWLDDWWLMSKIIFVRFVPSILLPKSKTEVFRESFGIHRKSAHQRCEKQVMSFKSVTSHQKSIYEIQKLQSWMRKPRKLCIRWILFELIKFHIERILLLFELQTCDRNDRYWLNRPHSVIKVLLCKHQGCSASVKYIIIFAWLKGKPRANSNIECMAGCRNAKRSFSDYLKLIGGFRSSWTAIVSSGVWSTVAEWLCICVHLNALICIRNRFALHLRFPKKKDSIESRQNTIGIQLTAKNEKKQ